MRAICLSTSELTDLQQNIMYLIIGWSHIYPNKPMPLKRIMSYMKEQKVKAPTAINAIHGLLLKGYIRRACIISNKTYFVMLRSI